MLSAISIMQRAADLLKAKGLKSELSSQAQAVIEAIVLESNANGLLVNQALVLRFDRQLNAVKQLPDGQMKKPTLEEVTAQGMKIELPSCECERFFDHYESNGWKVNKVPMKLWTAAMANWKRTWLERQTKPLNGNVQAIQNRTALNRVEERQKHLRGQFPLTDENRKTEWNELKIERTRLLTSLGFKV